ncbi:hypothetical protein D0T84_06915 [Dysgonomonas sp. 521]|uniref:hypothetical protein n=1 Tax=Dysgonomonas sp. 521 TaxID=2302932 RepID=UPI0013D87C15|nr:hypothetical protein [Dysgonomonas sp. 521]NDV94652.1 hypothetical protein [Dysgonomonas sp. 521]
MKTTKTQKQSTAKNLWRLIAIVAAFWFLNPGIRAQITIGSDEAPQDFSVLEIITTYTKGGLRLPQLSNDELTALTTTAFKSNEKAKGLTIYNTDAKCLQFWNGTEWIDACNSDIPTFLPGGGSTTIKIADPTYPTNPLVSTHSLSLSLDKTGYSGNAPTSYLWVVNNVAVNIGETFIYSPSDDLAWDADGKVTVTILCQMIIDGNPYNTAPLTVNVVR